MYIMPDRYVYSGIYESHAKQKRNDKIQIEEEVSHV